MISSAALIVLRSLPCDVFLGSHTGFYHQMTQKYAKLEQGGAEPRTSIQPATRC